MIPHFVRAAMLSPESSEGIAALFIINQAGWDAPYRFTSAEGELFDYTDPSLRSGITHGGDQYDYAVVKSARPDDVPGQAAELPLVIENVVQDLAYLAKQSCNALVVTLKHVALSDPDSVVEEFPPFKVLSVTTDLETNTVAFSLTLDPIENEPANMLKFSPDQFGGLLPQ